VDEEIEKVMAELTEGLTTATVASAELPEKEQAAEEEAGELQSRLEMLKS
jgi:hypothetical protein